MNQYDFDLLIEGSLLSFKYFENVGIIEVVSVYTETRRDQIPKDAQRGFVKFTFHGVSNIIHHPGASPLAFKPLEATGYNGCDERAPHVTFEEAVFKTYPNSLYIHFHWGYTHGELSFSSIQATKENKVAYGKESKENNFQYFEINANKPIDFCHPFA